MMTGKQFYVGVGDSSIAEIMLHHQYDQIGSNLI